MKDEAAQERECQNTAFTFFLLFVCLFTFFGRGGGGGRGESKLPCILSKTGFGYGGAKRLPKAYLILRVQCNRQIEEGWLT